MHARQKQNEFRIRDPGVSFSDLRGEWYQKTYLKLSRIIDNQFVNLIKNGIKGFLFHGEVGTGKTMLAKALAGKKYRLLFVDGNDIARSLYGESEKQVGQLFQEARGEPTIVLIDDCESVFPSRGWVKGQAWHVAQNNILLHELDDIDTSKMSVIMTTNMLDLMDKAVISRLFVIEFPLPTLEVKISVVEQRCKELQMKYDELVKHIEENEEKYPDLRKVLELVMVRYLEQF